ncbi:MAG TPA: copper-containing nitrite reductase [Gemmatimonadota bacterium]|nr:copper-containing nitrite reductase [Gemmatimonadota bacterium]
MIGFADGREKRDGQGRVSRREALKVFGAGSLGLAAVACGSGTAAEATAPAGTAAAAGGTAPAGTGGEPARAVTIRRLAADPTELPGPIGGAAPRTRHFLIEPREGVGEIEAGATFDYMTFGGRIPGPLLRARQGDRIRLTVRSAKGNIRPHNVDLHAVYGPGGGAAETLVLPGQEKTIEFRALYPGAFIYHCAVPGMDMHISSGMFGMILIEPPEGLPEVDHELYLGQHEVYTNRRVGEAGHHAFDTAAMLREDPTYVLLNGEKHALTDDVRGAIRARRGETARIYFVNGGPNLTSSFHPIGNVWSRAWIAGALANEPLRYVQTLPVPPGSTGVFELEFPVPEPIKLVDHALTRVMRKGMLGVIDVRGPKQADIFRAVDDLA